MLKKRRSSWAFQKRKSEKSEDSDKSATRKASGAKNRHDAASRWSVGSSDDENSTWMQILAEQPAISTSFEKAGSEDSPNMRSIPMPLRASSAETTPALGKALRTTSRNTAAAMVTRESTRHLLESAALSALARENIEELTTLHFGHELQARSKEIRQLKAAYHRVGMDQGKSSSNNDPACDNSGLKKGRPEMILISGNSGTGKSVLARELKQCHPGNCFHGKFDLQQDFNDQHSVSSEENSKTQEPFSAVLDAFEQLCAYLYCKCPESDQAMLQSKLLQAFGSHCSDDKEASRQRLDPSQGNILCAMIPSLCKLMRKGRTALDLQEEDALESSPSSTIGDSAQCNRLSYMFRCLTRIASNYLKPLVLVIDDMQWADEASLSVLAKLLTDAASPHFLLIGTYRNSSTSEQPPVVKAWLSNLRKEMAENATTTIEEICLDNFSVSDVNAFISRALKLDHEKTIRLSEIIHRKTNGNPFFVVQFLTTLRDMGIVDYSLGTMEWSWDEHRVKDLFVTDNVLQEILRVRIRNLSPMGRFLSQVAACFGTNFTQDLLFTGAQAIQKDCEDMMSFELCEAQMKEGINNLVAEGIFEHCWSEDDSSCSDLRFAHDQILEVAAADLLPWETAWQWKAVLARAMLWSKHANDPKWFYVIADLTNEGHSQLVLLENMEIVDMVIDINCRAGVKAMESGAYTAAIQYTDVALSLLGDCGKDTQSTIDLHTLAAHSGYCSGNFRSMQTHLDAILKDQLDIPFSAKLPAYVTLVLSHIAQTEWNQAINVGLEILRQLGFKLSQNVTALRILYELMRTNALIHSRSFDDLCDLPLLHDDMAIYTERIFDALATATYTMKSDFFPLLTLLHIQMCIQRGVGTYSPVAFATYGIIVGAKLGKLGEGYKMGEVAKHLLSRLPNKASTSRTIFLIHQFLSHWVKPAFQGIKISYEGYIVGLQIGDVESALYNRMSAALFSWACGQKLDVVEQEARKVCTESYEYQQRNVRSVMEPYWQQVLNLMGHSVDPLTMVGEAMSEGGVLADPNVQFYEGLNMYALKLQLGYIFGAPIKFMEEYLDKSKLLPELTLGSIQAQRHIFYEGAVAFLLANNYSGRKRRKWKRHGLKIKRKIERWLHEGHVNSIHAIPFYEAELQVIKRNRAKAKKFYEVTIRLSSKNGYQQDRALAHERAGANFMALGDSYWATYHLSSSRDCYLKWGAHAKVKQMQEKYADLCMLDITDRIDTPDNNSSIVTL